ncbi:hypothetical protein [Spirabiliibacterium falconis]|nr:hypothetical protein [Spirabiliibacterium falconis]
MMCELGYSLCDVNAIFIVLKMKVRSDRTLLFIVWIACIRVD